MTSVLKSWLDALSWKEQTVLLVSLRGPDYGSTVEVRAMVRWLRSVTLNNAAPGKTFMKHHQFSTVRQIAEDTPLVFDMLPVHFVTHLLHGFQVVAYRHPEADIAGRALTAYSELCEYLHVTMESPNAMAIRLADEVDTTV